ncbi:hypothetical protein [Streptomyces sp. Ag109_G2-6]|uniref:hypothetical protein n=1 Tax=Streptomyces sp. Ag109_G2-6 TaxID=2485154 RepID=UPI0009A533CD|nr:hypothetical protein [Streptomyces sp. Ag109_G2-6]
MERLREEADRILVELGEAEAVSVLVAGAAGGPMRARDLTVALGGEAVPARIECVRSMAKRLVSRGCAVAAEGLFAAAPGSVAEQAAEQVRTPTGEAASHDNGLGRADADTEDTEDCDNRVSCCSVGFGRR